MNDGDGRPVRIDEEGVVEADDARIYCPHCGERQDSADEECDTCGGALHPDLGLAVWLKQNFKVVLHRGEGRVVPTTRVGRVCTAGLLIAVAIGVWWGPACEPDQYTSVERDASSPEDTSAEKNDAEG